MNMTQYLLERAAVDAVKKLREMGWTVEDGKDASGKFWKCKMPGAHFVITRSVVQLQRYAGIITSKPMQTGGGSTSRKTL
jgi:hypothetical protein